MWEVLTLARDQPLCELNDTEVIENADSYYRNDPNSPAYPAQPNGCPKEIYDLMVECWNRQELNRPAFREINMFLQRKNMGYQPYPVNESLLQQAYSTPENNMPIV